MAAEAEGSNSSASADSYIGSLISLTSKCEIRYEGVLYTINADESSIGLRNVRSFGTEGRKKDGPQVPPIDKVYEYILFRGSDIKDLQVKNSPPIQPPPPINNDPAIIQSHYPHPSSTSTSLPSTVTSSLTDGNSHTAQVGLPPSNFQSGLPPSNFQSGLPLYQPGGNVGPWGPSPPQVGANGSGLAMPMYWQGYYGTPNGPQQQPMFRPPTGLPMPPSMQQPIQYSGFNNSFATGAPNLADFPYPLHTGPINSVNMTPTSITPSTLPLATLSSETLPNSLPKAPISTLVSSSMPSMYPLTTSGADIIANVPPISNKPTTVSGLNLPYQTMSQSVSSIRGDANSTKTEAPTPSLITPGQLLQSGHTTVSSTQPLQTAHKDVQMVQVSSSAPSEPSVPVSTAAQPPILPLPTPSRAVPRVNGNSFQTRHGYRGRERGRGMGDYRPVMKFTEEFDFTAMNEKFNKDEVWGDLGKGNKSHSRDKEGDGNISDENDYDDEDDAESSTKTVYNKDDFFDSLSSNALDRESNHGRTRFSEQQKIDTETFGEFSRYRGGRGFNRGGRGFNRGGGGYYGRGYGYNNNRGRGRGYSNQAN